MTNSAKRVSDHFVFDELSEEEKKFLENYMQVGRRVPNDYFYKNESKLKPIYFVREGTVLLGNNFGKPNEIAFQLSVSPIFLGIESMLFNTNYDQFAKPLSKVNYSRISKDAFAILLKKNEGFHQTIRKQLAESILDVEKKYFSFLEHSVAERVKLFLQEIYLKHKKTTNQSQKISLHMSHLEISRYLQCTRQMVTSILTRMRKDKLIDYSRNEFEILNLEQLKRW